MIEHCSVKVKGYEMTLKYCPRRKGSCPGKLLVCKRAPPWLGDQCPACSEQGVWVSSSAPGSLHPDATTWWLCRIWPVSWERDSGPTSLPWPWALPSKQQSGDEPSKRHGSTRKGKSGSMKVWDGWKGNSLGRKWLWKSHVWQEEN